LFSPNQAKSPVGNLSGGEKNRLLLAKTLAIPSNLLVLDEPTNDLDIDTLDILQEVLSVYDGTLLLISHDREFLDRIVTSTIVLEGDGNAQEYPGGYSDYIRQKNSTSRADNINCKEQNSPYLASKSKRKKIKNNDEKALNELSIEIDEIRKEIFKLTQEMEDTNRFAGKPNELNKLANTISKLIANKTSTEERWMALELLKEEQSKT